MSNDLGIPLAERLAGVEEIECVTPTSTGCRVAR